MVFPDFESLAAVPDGSLAGKIVLVDRHMVRMQDGSGYGPISHIRTQGPLLAAKKGAVAFLLRQASTNNDRLGHAGTTAYDKDGKAPVPAFSLTIPDADQIDRLEALGGPVHVRLFSGASYVTGTHSQNIIGEIRGVASIPEEVILIGAHMDSWDQGTGATDDGTGDAIIVAAAKLIRTCRCKLAPHHPRGVLRLRRSGATEPAPAAPSAALPTSTPTRTPSLSTSSRARATSAPTASMPSPCPRAPKGPPFADQAREQVCSTRSGC